jgi:hypothetical protein
MSRAHAWYAAISGFLLAFLPLAVWPQHDMPEWRLQREDPATSTRVWSGRRPDGVPAFRATTVVDARLSSLAAVLLDTERAPEWVYRLREAVLLRTEGPTRGVTLVVTNMPFPLADRESVVAWEISQDPRTLDVMVACRAATDSPPQRPDRVRMAVFESRWVLSPRPDGRVDVLFEGMGDPGGNLAWPVLRHFAGAAVWEGPWQTLLALHRIVRQPPFPQAELRFIREPGR